MVNLVVLFLCVFGSSHASVDDNHAIYVSVVEIEQLNAQRGALRVKVFYDDLEASIRNYSGTSVDFADEITCDSQANILKEYFSEHLKVQIQNSAIDYDFIRCEKNGESIWLEFDFTTMEEWTLVTIQSDYFMELFPTQTNVFTVSSLLGKKMFRLTKSETSYEISF